ncbi:hypothetical protein [Mycolicibacterium goodii]|uniref:hypothetical protein n=1 Tax=Mycolicibacterium goodii TaxID=134601 RepID=UPI001055CFFB|nr:hypothetical protein [Mycolicibacterium goodii]
MTREHIFRNSWRKKIDTTLGFGVLGVTNTDAEKFRQFTRYGLDGEPKSSKQEDLFSVTVKRVCARCNNTWMNDLDTLVEPWVFDPANEAHCCNPIEFRRWAIKVALLRCYYEHPASVEPGDPEQIYNGDDIPEWHIFIGRTRFPEHRHAFCGIGPIIEGEGRLFGISQVTWTLGHSFVTAIRLKSDHPMVDAGFRNFKHHNRFRGIQLLEVLPNSTVMPSVSTLPDLPRSELQSLAWFYTPNAASPIAEEIRRTQKAIEYMVAELGVETREL